MNAKKNFIIKKNNASLNQGLLIKNTLQREFWINACLGIDALALIFGVRPDTMTPWRF